MSGTWPRERVEKLLVLLQDDRRLSSREMGAILGVSRNAVIGKVGRMGLKMPIAIDEQAMLAIHLANVKRREMARLKTDHELWQALPGERRERVPPIQLKLSQAPPEPPPEPIKDTAGEYYTPETVPNSGCRFPYGDPSHGPFHYCGHPGKDRSHPWCDFHQKIVLLVCYGAWHKSLNPSLRSVCQHALLLEDFPLGFVPACFLHSANNLGSDSPPSPIFSR
jgi:hypothetical protein